MLILHNSSVIKIYINILFSISDFSLFSSYHFFILHFFTIRFILGLFCLFSIPFLYKFYCSILIYCIYFLLVYILFHFVLHLILLNISLHLLNKFKKARILLSIIWFGILYPYKDKLILIFKKQVKKLIILNENFL
jgi:hypothetical protein